MCKDRLDTCIPMCKNNCEQCKRLADRTATKNDCRYRAQQQIKGEIALLELNSFRDPLQCLKVTCDCQADYRACTRSCGKVIY